MEHHEHCGLFVVGCSDTEVDYYYQIYMECFHIADGKCSVI